MNQEMTGGASKSSATAAKRHSKKPKYSRFTQQELPAWKPILTPGWVIAAFVLIGITFIPIGLASLFASERVVEIVDRYDDGCFFLNTNRSLLVDYIRNPKSNKTCTRSLTVPKKMRSPIYIYYQLGNFYQNHRRYVKSRSDKQLRSRKGEDEIKDCQPIAKSGEKPIVPCGLIAWSLFNDTFAFSIKNKALTVDKKDIAWKSDKEHKFGSDVYPKNFQRDGLIGGGKLNHSIPLSEQEDLMVWMRTAALPTFRKLYGKITVDLEANETIRVVIQNNYNTYEFGGEKKLVLSTTSWIGGKNNFLGIAYLCVGGICLFLAINFILMYIFRPRPLGDPSYLSWNRNPSGH